MTTKNSNLMTSKISNASLDVKRNDQTKKEFKLKHEVKLDKVCNGVRSVNVTFDNRYLIITYENSIPRIRVVDLEKLEFLPYKYEGHTDSVRLTSITRDNKAFHTASWDASSRRFEIESGKSTHLLSGFGRSPSCFLHPDQKHLFIASYDSDQDFNAKNNGRCYNIAAKEIIGVYIHTEERISPEAIDIAYNDGKVYTGSDDGCAYQWDLRGKKPLIKYFSFKGTVRKLAVSDNHLAAACTDGFVRVHQKLSGEYFMYFLHSEKDIRDIRISENETSLWSATEGGSVRCFNLVTGQQIYHRRIHPLWIWSICLMNDEKILVTGSGDGTVAFLSANTGQVLARLFNLPGNNNFLITCPPDNAFPSGFFYTTSTDLIRVFMEDDERHNRENLDLNDPRREAYVNKLNLKNLIITRLKNIRHYTSLTENYMQNKSMLDQITGQKVPPMLKA